METLQPAIILIEKDEVTLEIYQRELCNSFTVFTFTELNGVIETLTQQDIQAIAIEPEICAGRGWEFIDAIQKTLSGRDIPIIVCSTRDAPGKIGGRRHRPLSHQTRPAKNTAREHYRDFGIKE